MAFLALGTAACGSLAPDAPDTLPPLPTPRVFAPPPTPAPPAWMVGTIAVAAPVEDGTAVTLMDVTGRSEAGVLEPRFEAIDHLAWSPDGRWLAVTARRDANWDLWLLDPADASVPPQRLTDTPGYDGGAAFSPDGSRLAFERYDSDGWGVFTLSLAGISSTAEKGAGAESINLAPAVRLSPVDERAMEPTWSPDGRTVLWSGWRSANDAMGLFATPVDGGATMTVVLPPSPERHDVDLRRPAFAAEGNHLGWLALRHGTGQVTSGRWDAAIDAGIAAGAGSLDADGSKSMEATTDDDGVTRSQALVTASGGALTASATAFAWAPIASSDRGGAIAFLAPGRRSVQLELRAVDGRDRRTMATLPEGTRALAWTAAPPPANLAPWAPPESAPSAGAGFAGRRAPGLASEVPFGDPERPGLSRIDIDAPGPRIHAGLEADYAALRAKVNAETGRDFLGTVSDMWRSLGFYSKGSAFYSWHKTGRAFDTTQELYGAGGRRDMVLVREDLRGRTYWRMFLRAGAQDGSRGSPLREPGWRFATSRDSELVRREGGERGSSVTGGWFVDFTALAAERGWHRIPANRRPGFDWRENWAAIEFWHYERRDGLSWSEAARQVYDDETLATELDREQLRERGISSWRLGALGMPGGRP